MPLEKAYRFFSSSSICMLMKTLLLTKHRARARTFFRESTEFFYVQKKKTKKKRSRVAFYVQYKYTHTHNGVYIGNIGGWQRGLCLLTYSTIPSIIECIHDFLEIAFGRAAFSGLCVNVELARVCVRARHSTNFEISEVQRTLFQELARFQSFAVVIITILMLLYQFNIFIYVRVLLAGIFLFSSLFKSCALVGMLLFSTLSKFYISIIYKSKDIRIFG